MFIKNCYRKEKSVFYLIIAFLSVQFTIFSQTYNAEIQKADEYYINNEFEKAVKYYNKAYESDPENYELNLKMARSYVKLKQYQFADKHYQKVLSYYEKKDPSVFVEYGELQMILGNPELARNYFTKYNNLIEGNDIQSFKYQNSIEYEDKFYDDSSFYQIKPLEFNSPANEQNPLIYQGKLVYETDQLFYNQQNIFNSIYYQSSEEALTSRPSVIEGKNATKYKGKGFTINTANNELIISKVQINNHDSIYSLKSSQIDNNFKVINNEIDFPLDDFKGNIYYPAVSNNGNILVFSSDLGSYNRTLDLYVSIKNENGFSNPKPLQGMINTLNNESFPYFLNDSILFFASDGHGGIGGYDIFYTNLNSPNLLPVNIGYPLNSRYDDVGICISNSFKDGFISSNRNNSGTTDLFHFEISKIHALGLITDEYTGNNLKDVYIEIQDVNGNSSNQVLADNGYFSMIYQPDEAYNISISKPGYKTKKYKVTGYGNSFAGLNSIDLGIFSIQQDTLQPIITNASIAVVETIESKEDIKFEEKTVKPAEFTDEQPLSEDTSPILFRVQIAASRIEMSEKDLKRVYSGTKEISVFKEENWYKYYIGAYNSFFEANSVCHKSQVKGAFVVAYKGDQKLVLREAIREKNVTKALQEFSENNTPDQPKIANVLIYYPYNEYQPAEKELNKLLRLIDLININPQYHIEIFGYADKQGNSYYNIGLALERSKYIKNYLVDKKIDPSRIYLRSIRQIDINTKSLVKNDPENRKVEVVVFE